MKKIPFILCAGALLALASCGGGGNPSSNTSVVSDESQPSSSEPSKESEISSASQSQSESKTESTVSSSEESSKEPWSKADIHESFIIHYHRDDGDYKTWTLWLWATGKVGTNNPFNYKDSYGGICVVPIANFYEDVAGQNLNYIVRDPDWGKDVSEDRYVALDTLTPDGNGNYEFWLYTGVKQHYTAEPGNVSYLSICSFASMSKLNLTVGAGTLFKAEILEDGTVVQTENYENGTKKVSVDLKFTPKIDRLYELRATYENDYVVKQNIAMIGLYEDEGFNNLYYYEGDDLGVTYTASASTFKVWSPVSKAITLKIYDTGTPADLGADGHPGSDTPAKTVEMTKGEKGVFSARVEEDLNGKYYTYEVNNYMFDKQEVVDPYAKAVGVNGLRGMILDLASTNPDGWDDFTPRNIDRKALTVYETHIADLTSSSSWNGTAENARKYAGFHEEGTRFIGADLTVKTGFDHVKELGVNAVQILPMFDQANDEVNVEFNWGYNPLNYNVPEGCYSSNPYDGEVRIRELKELILDYGKANMNIIMDVVYNHVNSVNGLNFDVLMPYYYFRYDSSLGLTNGSGCGNETASEHLMFRKFMIDSATYWAKEYKLGGFRFDLMGLHDLDTMELLTKEVEKVNPGAVIYGEPWTGGDTPLSSLKRADQKNQSKYVGYGAFNDRIRDALISGGLNDSTSKGWATITSGKANSAAMNLAAGILGQQTNTLDPDKTVSYATCHDNYTLYDRAYAAYAKELQKDPKALTDEMALKMARLAQSVVLTSQGTAFLLAGEEMLRTKGGDHNSYKSSYEVNELNYAKKIDYIDLFKTYQTLIKLKQDFAGLHLAEADARAVTVTRSETNTILSYELTDGVNTYKFAHANGIHAGDALEETVDFSGYTLLHDTLGVSNELTANTKLQAFESIIAYK
ncbi:MAG: type I pullulanase [Bacilli bacterium]|nr:type I pullulanase [Bacilli bacterium]